MHESGERVRGLSRLKVSEVRGEGGTLLTQAQGQVSRASDVQPSPPPDSPIINGSSVKGWSVHVGIGAHRARLAALRESVGFRLGSSAVATGKARSGTTGVEGATKPRRASGPIVGETMKAPAEPRCKERKNNDATTTHPPTQSSTSVRRNYTPK